MITWKTFFFGGYVALFLAVSLHVGRAQEALPAPAAPTPLPLRQILITTGLEAAQALTPAPEAGFVVMAPPVAFLDAAELKKRLAPGENRPLDEKLLAEIAQVVENFLRQNGFPIATAVIPAQNIRGGIVRVAMIFEKSAAAPAPEASTPHPLRQILITTGLEAAQALTPDPEAGFVVMAPPVAFLDATELKKRLASGENRPLDDKLLAAIAQVVENFLRQNDFPIATAVIPPQNIEGGIVRVAVLLGKFRNLRFQGNRWFSESLLREKLRVEHGQMVRLSELDRALSWTNNNPFRRVRVHMEPVPGTDEVDLIIGVQERLPLRLMALYDNAGNATLGENRFIGSISYANLWGRDHQASYQYITSDQPEVFKAHGFDYRVPLPWRHYLQFSASYLRATPEFFDGLFTQDGESITSELRYSFPLRAGERPVDFFAALNFKRSNNDLVFGGDQFLTTTDIFQVSSGVSTVIRDKRGAWALSASLTVSPGEINSRNSDAAFRESRFGSDSHYAFGSFSFQRLLTLERGWEFMSRGVIQASTHNLISSEQLTAGGAGTVRGFNENVFSGDQGFVFSNDLLLPLLKKPLPFKTKNQPILETRFLFFYDAANVRRKQRFATDAKFAPLASTGVGVRMNVGTYLNVTADYGWQISDLPYPVEEHGRGHIKVTLAY